MVENKTLEVATLAFNNCIRTNKKAIATVANTSKKPSTHRCTTQKYFKVAIIDGVCLTPDNGLTAGTSTSSSSSFLLVA